MALKRTDGPTAIVLTRQKLAALEREGEFPREDAERGAYVLADAERPEAVLAATGSEVHLALEAAGSLRMEGRGVRVVSVTCLELLLQQDEAYRNELFPPDVPVATFEAGRSDPWRVLAGKDGLCIGIDRFGASAPGGVVAEQLGLSPTRVIGRLRDWLP